MRVSTILVDSLEVSCRVTSLETTPRLPPLRERYCVRERALRESRANRIREAVTGGAHIPGGRARKIWRARLEGKVESGPTKAAK